jgi:hypothetical protein
MGGEEWRISINESRLILTGGRPRGTLYAVYRFLEDVLGVRWWSPWETYVPRQRDLCIATCELHGQPRFEAR